jgi:hypothetical protein
MKSCRSSVRVSEQPAQARARPGNCPPEWLLTRMINALVLVEGQDRVVTTTVRVELHPGLSVSVGSEES